MENYNVKIEECIKEIFCKAICEGCPPRSTCTSLGTCDKYDRFVKLINEQKNVLNMNPKSIKIEFRNCVGQIVATHTLEGCSLLKAADYANNLIRVYGMVLRAKFVILE